MWLTELAQTAPVQFGYLMATAAFVGFMFAIGLGAGLSGLGKIGQTIHEHHDADPEPPAAADPPVYVGEHNGIRYQARGASLRLTGPGYKHELHMAREES